MIKVWLKCYCVLFWSFVWLWASQNDYVTFIMFLTHNIMFLNTTFGCFLQHRKSKQQHRKSQWMQWCGLFFFLQPVSSNTFCFPKWRSYVFIPRKCHWRVQMTSTLTKKKENDVIIFGRVENQSIWSKYSDLTRVFTPKGSWGREIPLLQGNLGWWNILIWPDLLKHCLKTFGFSNFHAIFVPSRHVSFATKKQLRTAKR